MKSLILILYETKRIFRILVSDVGILIAII